MPDLPLATIVAAGSIIVLAYTVFGLTGFGAAVVGVPLLAHLLSIRFVVPMMLVFDLTAALLLGTRDRRHIAPGELLRLLPFVAIGMAIGAIVLVGAPEHWLLVALGTFIVAYSTWSLVGTPTGAPISARWVVPAGVVGGVFSALFGSGGPIYTVYLARRLGDPIRLRATVATLIFFAAWARLVIFSSTGLLFQPSLLRLAALLVPCAVVGYLIGSHLHRRIAPRGAARVLWLLLFASGGSLLVRGVLS
jgi:hypothetical protein